MSRIQVLDCTLRDGGYCNDWSFGFENAKRIVAGLCEANIEIIECGFLTKRVARDPDVTRFPTPADVAAILPPRREGRLFVAMMNYGEYDIDALPPRDGASIDGIRVAYHKKDRAAALALCEQIQAKGYLVFIQAMVTPLYTDEEFLDTIRRVNRFKPYVFYIVDSFGMMKGRELDRLFRLADGALDPAVRLGFHSHNNMQLAFANAMRLAERESERPLVLDSSVYGMGRGAGNLNTELLVEYLNENAGGQYRLKPLLALIDEILNEFYQRKAWGYSLPNYISAAHNAHPNYAGFLDDKKTLTFEDMNAIFSMMSEEKRVSFDRAYIEGLYRQYMEKEQARQEHRAELSERLRGKRVLLIAPGKSSVTEKARIAAFAAREDVLCISVNFAYELPELDYVFLSNLRRWRELDGACPVPCIVTSNIPAENAYCQLPYGALLNDEPSVTDNAGLMAIRFLMDCGVKEIHLAGFDGYTHDSRENYGKDGMAFETRAAVLDAMNAGMGKVLRAYSRQLPIRFLTAPRHVAC